MGGKQKLEAKSLSPGPGKYFDEIITKREGPTWKLGIKLPEKKKASRNFPGANHYEPKEDLVRVKSPEISTTRGGRSK